MLALNRVTLMGYVTKDPDVRYTPNKAKVARFTIAIKQTWKNKATGELKENTDFIICVAWEPYSDIIDKYVHKGRPIYIEGRLSARSYDDPKTGQRKFITEVVTDKIILLYNAPKDQNNSYGYGAYGTQQASQPISDGISQTPESLRAEEAFSEDFPLDFGPLDNVTDDTKEVDIPF